MGRIPTSLCRGTTTDRQEEEGTLSHSIPQMGPKKEGGKWYPTRSQDRAQHPCYQEDSSENAPAISSYDQAHGL